ncbi:hypothetical protein [Nostoc sp. NIES-3756]|nr:hypothetical protein [Nostoc sp. NIES-3756]
MCASDITTWWGVGGDEGDEGDEGVGGEREEMDYGLWTNDYGLMTND